MYWQEVFSKQQQAFQWTRSSLLLAALLLYALSSSSQTTLDFQQFTTADGLASNFVVCIHQDKEGFLWIGTENGLNRFDGKHFLRFYHDPEDSETLDDNWVMGIFEDSQRNFWVGTTSGLNRINRESEKVQRIPLPYSDKFPKFPVSAGIFENTEGDLGVIRLMPEYPFSWGEVELYDLMEPSSSNDDWKIEPLLRLDSLFEHLELPRDTKLAYLSTDESWVYSTRDIYRVHIPSQKLIPVIDIKTGKSAGELMGEIYYVRSWGEQLYISAQNGLYLLNIKSSSIAFQLLKVLEDNPLKATIAQEGLVMNALSFPDSNGTDLVYKGRNAGLLNLESGLIEWFQKPDQTSDGPFHDVVKTTFRDRQGKYWVGTEGSGFFLLKAQENDFNFFEHKLDDPKSIPEGQVRSYLEDDNGNLWVAFLNHGLTQLSRTKEGNFRVLKDITPSQNDANALPTDRIVKIIQGGSGNLWLATLTHGIVKMDSTGGNMQTFSHNPDDTNSLSANRIWGLARDKQGYIWAGSWENGLNKLDPISGQVKRYFHDPDDSTSLGSDNIRYLYFDRQDNLWIGTENGLGKYDPDTDQFIHFKHDPNDPSSLSNDLVWAIHEDKEGNIWVGTNTGLNRFSKETQSFERFYEKDGLPDNTIFGILEDDDGSLWISTENGLARKITGTKAVSFLSLGLEDGLGTLAFLPKAILKSSHSNTLYFGSTDGIQEVWPTQLNERGKKVKWGIHKMVRFKRKSNVLVTDYFLSPGESVIELGHEDQSISFSLADLNWIDNTNYTYEYQLKGLSDQWLPLSEDMELTLSNLSPGKYRLLARGKHFGQALEASELLKLRVYPPWWWSWWAYCVYGLALLLVLWQAYRFQLKQQFNRQEREKLQELNDFKNEFFTNITHEFRTPLTIILGIANQLKEKPKRLLKAGPDLILKHGNNLLHLINQILELQKLESGALLVKMQQGDIVPIIKNVFKQFEAYADTKRLQWEMSLDEEEVIMDFDQEKILRILSNLLSNAIKFTPEKGKVSLQLSKLRNAKISGKEYLKLVVKDSGTGISQDQIRFVFNRFYQGSNGDQENLGTGIGLSLTQELVRTLNGKIEVNSHKGQGTAFMVLLPISRKAEKIASNATMGDLLTAFDTSADIKNVRMSSNGDFPLALVVEDNPDIADYLSLCLEDHYQIEMAQNGQFGIDKALELIPDIIISDVMMPEKDGFELCETLKEDLRSSHIPIILLTAKSDVESRITGLKYGADDYLAKPFREEELLARMENLLNIRKQLQERYQDFKQSTLIPPATEKPSREEEFLIKLNEIVESRMEDVAFDLDELSKTLYLSRSQLGRKVKALTGKSPSIFVRSIRLQKARALLLNSEFTVKEVAFKVGFVNPEHFSRSYSKEFGESPRKTLQTKNLHK